MWNWIENLKFSIVNTLNILNGFNWDFINFFTIISLKSVCYYFLVFEINLINYINLKKSQKILKKSVQIKKIRFKSNKSDLNQINPIFLYLKKKNRDFY